MPQLPDHLAVTDESSPEHPWRLVTAPARQFLNTTFTETDTSRQREGRPTALVHPEDCRELGLAEGDRVRIGNRKGSVVVHVLPFDGLQRNVVVVESIWHRSEEHTSELQSLMRISYAVFCLKTKAHII